MLLFSSAISKHKLSFTKLSDCIHHLPIVAKWAEDEWGYIRNKGVEYRMRVMDQIKHNLYVGTLCGKPVAMFALFQYEFDPAVARVFNETDRVSELMYVYVDKDYRGLGFGRQLIEISKLMSSNDGNDVMIFDTLKPSLNRLYEKFGADVICEGRLFSYPTDVLSMRL